jgi:hypothetical protein
VGAVWEQRFAALVRKVAALRESTSLELLPDLMPVLSVLDPSAAEQLVIRGERLCMSLFTSPAVVGRRAAVELANISLDQRLLIVLDELHAYAPAAGAGELELTWSTSGFANAAAHPAYFTDRRGVGTFPNISQPLAALRSGDIDNAGASTPFARIGMPASAAGVTVRPRAVLAGMNGIRVVASYSVLNAELRGYAIWRERIADAAELTPGY